MLTRFGKPVGTTITFRLLASVRSVPLNGSTSPDAASGGWRQERKRDEDHPQQGG
jgi:hypothetical protein